MKIVVEEVTEYQNNLSDIKKMIAEEEKKLDTIKNFIKQARKQNKEDADAKKMAEELQQRHDAMLGKLQAVDGYFVDFFHFFSSYLR